MNKISIIEISAPNIFISEKGSNKDLNNQLQMQLFQWTGVNWNVFISENNNNIKTSLKESLVKEFQLSEEWNIITKNFKEAKVIDIIISNNKFYDQN